MTRLGAFALGVLVWMIAASPAAAEEEPSDKDPWKSYACVKACEAGGEAIDTFCRTLPGRTKKQIAVKAACWAASRGTTGGCIVFCYAHFGPPAKP